MIRYALTCANDHGFESWFASAAACESLVTAGRVSCIHCGSTQVRKSLMAPAVNLGSTAPASGSTAPAKPAPGPLSMPQGALEEALAALRAQVEANSEYVGLNFSAEARAIHAGEAPERSIFGEARLEEARALLEEGVPIAPLPFLPARKAN